MSGLLAERVLDLLLDVAEVFAERPFLFLGEETERHAHDALRELHVQPILAVLRAARHVEIELTHARAIVAHVGLIPWHRARPEVGEETKAVHPVGPRWKVVNRVALDLQTILKWL